MKTPKGIREHDADELRKAKRLDPIRKSGKERHSLYRRSTKRTTRISSARRGANPYSTTSTKGMTRRNNSRNMTENL